ncbi:MAG: hypothetical protein WCP95_00935 [Actinomycetes bacterium]
MNRRALSLAFVAMIALGVPLLAGCGGVQGAVEKAAGDAIGGNVDINSKGLSITDSNGNQVQLGEDVTMPGNWPAAVPQLEGGKLVSVMVAGDGASANAMWTTDAAVADAAKSYSDALIGAGFTADQNANAAGAETGQFSGNGYTVNMVVSGSGDTTSVLVNAEKSGASASAS